MAATKIVVRTDLKVSSHFFNGMYLLHPVTGENDKREKVHEHDTLAGLYNKDRRKIIASPIATSS